MLIGICGFKSSGKDTVADYFVKHQGFKRLSFASAVKDVVSVIFNWPRDKLEGLTPEDREWREQIDNRWSQLLNMPQLTPRFAMQYFATDLFRNHFHPDIWLKIIENKLDKNEKIVISDCRFQNEIDMIKKNNGIILEVHRNMPQWFYKDKHGEEALQLHASEREWLKCNTDYVIENNGTIDELHSNIFTLFIIKQ